MEFSCGVYYGIFAENGLIFHSYLSQAESAEPPMLDNEEQTMLVCWNVHYPVIVNYLGKYKITGVTSSKKSVIKVCKNEDGSKENHYSCR